MLLRHTTAEIKERKALTVNPAKTCQPVGAMYAALGLHRCLPHSHGSQGCCAYHRSALTKHYKEPVMAASSSFTEGSAVFGGQSNLLQSIRTIFTVYQPDVIAVHTTCLSETIGDDIVQIVQAATDDGKIPKGRRVIHCNTPSYVGSHVTGFSNMTKALVKYLALNDGPAISQVNIVSGWVEPSDMQELKRMCALMRVPVVLFPDTSGVMNAPQTGQHEFYPSGGVTVSALETTGRSMGTLALGPTASEAAAKLLDKKYKVGFVSLELPIGLEATDRFVDQLHHMAGVEVPSALVAERGQLLDLIADMEQYLHGKRVALWGDPDQLVSLAEFLVTLGMEPVYLVTGTPGKAFEKRIAKALGDFAPHARFKQGAGADLFLLHQWIKQEKVDLLIGNTYGKYISRDEDIPLIRHGFPILDRAGHQYFPTVGYRGALRLLEKILSAVMDRQDRDAPEESFELTM